MYAFVYISLFSLSIYNNVYMYIYIYIYNMYTQAYTDVSIAVQVVVCFILGLFAECKMEPPHNT